MSRETTIHNLVSTALSVIEQLTAQIDEPPVLDEEDIMLIQDNLDNLTIRADMSERDFRVLLVAQASDPVYQPVTLLDGGHIRVTVRDRTQALFTLEGHAIDVMQELDEIMLAARQRNYA